MYDLIGDIHGHADELLRLLATLGYQTADGVYRHPARKAVFLGDFIDRVLGDAHGVGSPAEIRRVLV